MTYAERIRDFDSAEALSLAAIRDGDRVAILLATISLLAVLEVDKDLRSKSSLVEPYVLSCELVHKLINSLDASSGNFLINKTKKSRDTIPSFFISQNVVDNPGYLPVSAVSQIAVAALAAIQPVDRPTVESGISYPDTFPVVDEEEWAHEDELDALARVPEIPEGYQGEVLGRTLSATSTTSQDDTVLLPYDEDESFTRTQIQNESASLALSPDLIQGMRSLGEPKSHRRISYDHVPDIVRSIWTGLGAGPLSITWLWESMFTDLWSVYYTFWYERDATEFDSGGIPSSEGIRVRWDFLLARGV